MNMLDHLTFTPQALRILTEDQKRKLLDLMCSCKMIEVSQDVLSTQGMLYVILHYRQGSVIHGGIEQNGQLHT